MAIGAFAALAACGNPAAEAPRAAQAPAGAASAAGAGAGYDDIVGAVTRADVPICEPADGGRYLALPAPAAAAAHEYSYFRYLEGRIYEFGPCQLTPGRRNELRMYRYSDAAGRDAALRDVSERGTRPTSTFAFRDVWAVELWSPEPGLDSPAGQVAAQVHAAIGRVPQARHLDVPVA